MTPGADRRWDGVLWGAWGIALIGVFTRACVPFSTLPYWDIDPMQIVAAEASLGPAGSLTLDAAILAACGVALVAHARLRRAVSHVMWQLWLIGVVGVTAHAWLVRGGSMENLRIGSAWAAALGVGLTAGHVCRDPRLGRRTLALGLGIVGLFAAKGAAQVFVEHAETVAEFRRNREAFLAAHGWSPDSVMARTFERRLSQPEATGWFGLSNVLASFAAASFAGMLGLVVIGRAEVAGRLDAAVRRARAIVCVGLVGAIGVLVLTHSKAGIALSLAGVALVGTRLAWAREGRLARWCTPRIGGALALSACGAVVLAVVARGVVGERIGELSVLFRWFYLIGAVRIAGGSFPMGCGPGGFKDAYLLAKPPISPEEVESPHFLVMDYAATLGVFGLAWATVFLWLLWRAGGALFRSTDAAGAFDVRGNWPRIAILAVAPIVVSALVEAPVTTGEVAVAKLAGLALWVAVAIGAEGLMWRMRPWAVGAGVAAILLAAHAQFDLAGVGMGSAALLMLVVGTAAGAGAGLPMSLSPKRAIGPGLGVAIVGGAMGWNAARAWTWERTLAAGSAEARVVAGFQARIDALGADARLVVPERETLRSIAGDLARAVGEAPAKSQEEFDRQLQRLVVKQAERALTILAGARPPAADGMRMGQIESRLMAARGAALGVLGDIEGRDGALAAAVDRAVREAEASDRCAAWGWAGTMARSAYEQTGAREDLEAALDAWERAAALDPYGTVISRQVYRALREIGRDEEARKWGRRLLKADAGRRLDPLMRMPDEERAEIERFLGG